MSSEENSPEGETRLESPTLKQQRSALHGQNKNESGQIDLINNQ